MKQVLTVEEVAERLSVKPRTVYKMLERGQLRGVRAGRLWRVPESAFSAYLKGMPQEEYDDEPLSSEDLAAVKEGMEEIKRGEFVTLNQYESERGL